MRLFSSLEGDRGGQVFLIVLALITAAVIVLNQWVPSDHPLHLSAYPVTLMGKYLTYALLALSVDLIWGYLGILSLGHGAFFALGGYAMGMYLMRQIGTRGVYGDPDLPDFMVFLNWQELPVFWYGFDQFWFAALMVMVAPGLLAFVFGWLAFRSRVTGVYLSIITQALTYALMLAFFRNEMGFGGNNGLTDFKDILGFSLQADGTRIEDGSRSRSNSTTHSLGSSGRGSGCACDRRRATRARGSVVARSAITVRSGSRASRAC